MTPPTRTHEQRRALIEKPFPITYIHPVKRWAGVQIVHDDQWKEDAKAWAKRFTQNTGEEN